MKYPLVRAAFFGQPWALLPRAFDEYARLLTERAEGAPLDLAALEAKRYGAESASRTPKGVALLELHGPIFARAGGLMSGLSGYVDPYRFAADVRQAAADDAISEIVLSLDSPGGTVAGTGEAALAVWEARQAKPVTAVVNDTAASAAYWIASQAGRIVTMPSGVLGSVGVIMTHYDYSRKYEDNGITPTVLRTGAHKAVGQEVEPLDAEKRAVLMAEMDSLLAVFAADVARGRGLALETVMERFGAGDVFVGADAVEVGLADGVASLGATLAAALARTATPKRASRPRKGRHMDPIQTALLGLADDATPEETQAAMEGAREAILESERARIAAALGAEDATDATLAGLKQEAADGRQYRADLLDALHAAVIRAEGNDDTGQAAADRLKRLMEGAPIADLRAEVERHQAKAAAAIPASRQSRTEPKSEPETRDATYA